MAICEGVGLALSKEEWLDLEGAGLNLSDVGGVNNTYPYRDYIQDTKSSGWQTRSLDMRVLTYARGKHPTIPAQCITDFDVSYY